MTESEILQKLKAALSMGFRIAEQKYNRTGLVASQAEIDRETEVVQGLLLREPKFLNSETMYGVRLDDLNDYQIELVRKLQESSNNGASK